MFKEIRTLSAPITRDTKEKLNSISTIIDVDSTTYDPFIQMLHNCSNLSFFIVIKQNKQQMFYQLDLKTYAFQLLDVTYLVLYKRLEYFNIINNVIAQSYYYDKQYLSVIQFLDSNQKQFPFVTTKPHRFHLISDHTYFLFADDDLSLGAFNKSKLKTPKQADLRVSVYGPVIWIEFLENICIIAQQYDRTAIISIHQADDEKIKTDCRLTLKFDPSLPANYQYLDFGNPILVQQQGKSVQILNIDRRESLLLELPVIETLFIQSAPQSHLWSLFQSSGILILYQIDYKLNIVRFVIVNCNSFNKTEVIYSLISQISQLSFVKLQQYLQFICIISHNKNVFEAAKEVQQFVYSDSDVDITLKLEQEEIQNSIFQFIEPNLVQQLCGIHNDDIFINDLHNNKLLPDLENLATQVFQDLGCTRFPNIDSIIKQFHQASDQLFEENERDKQKRTRIKGGRFIQIGVQQDVLNRILVFDQYRQRFMVVEINLFNQDLNTHLFSNLITEQIKQQEGEQEKFENQDRIFKSYYNTMINSVRFNSYWLSGLMTKMLTEPSISFNQQWSIMLNQYLQQQFYDTKMMANLVISKSVINLFYQVCDQPVQSLKYIFMVISTLILHSFCTGQDLIQYHRNTKQQRQGGASGSQSIFTPNDVTDTFSVQEMSMSGSMLMELSSIYGQHSSSSLTAKQRRQQPVRSHFIPENDGLLIQYQQMPSIQQLGFVETAFVQSYFSQLNGIIQTVVLPKQYRAGKRNRIQQNNVYDGIQFLQYNSQTSNLFEKSEQGCKFNQFINDILTQYEHLTQQYQGKKELQAVMQITSKLKKQSLEVFIQTIDFIFNRIYTMCSLEQIEVAPQNIISLIEVVENSGLKLSDQGNQLILKLIGMSGLQVYSDVIEQLTSYGVIQ